MPAAHNRQKLAALNGHPQVVNAFLDFGIAADDAILASQKTQDDAIVDVVARFALQNVPRAGKTTEKHTHTLNKIALRAVKERAWGLLERLHELNPAFLRFHAMTGPLKQAIRALDGEGVALLIRLGSPLGEARVLLNSAVEGVRYSQDAASRDKAIAIVRLLADAGVLPTKETGITAIEVALCAGQWRLVAALLEVGCPVSANRVQFKETTPQEQNIAHRWKALQAQEQDRKAGDDLRSQARNALARLFMSLPADLKPESLTIKANHGYFGGY